MKRCFSQFYKIQYVLKASLQFEKFECLMNLILKLKMSLEETSFTISKNFNLYKRCHLKRHFPQFHKFQYILKIVEMILKWKMSFFNINSKFSTVYEKSGLYWKCLFKRHFPLENWIYTKVSLEKTISTWQKIQYALKMSFKRHLPQFDKFECLVILKLKMSLWRDNFYNS